MTSPHDVFGLPTDADPDTIRRRYLELVRQFPPEADPERFAAIRKAYDDLRDPFQRYKCLLFEPSAESVGEVVQRIRAASMGVRFPTDILLSLARKDSR